MLNKLVLVADFVVVLAGIFGIAYMQVKIEKLAYKKLKEERKNV